MKKLIQLKSNIDLQDSLGYSALIVACKAGHIDLVRLLIASGAIKEKGVSDMMKSNPDLFLAGVTHLKFWFLYIVT